MPRWHCCRHRYGGGTSASRVLNSGSRSDDIGVAALQRAACHQASAEPPSTAVQAAMTLLDRQLLETPALAVALLNHVPHVRAAVGTRLARYLDQLDGKRTLPESRHRTSLPGPNCHTARLAAFHVDDRRRGSEAGQRRRAAHSHATGGPSSPYGVEPPLCSYYCLRVLTARQYHCRLGHAVGGTCHQRSLRRTLPPSRRSSSACSRAPLLCRSMRLPSAACCRMEGLARQGTTPRRQSRCRRGRSRPQRRRSMRTRATFCARTCAPRRAP